MYAVSLFAEYNEGVLRARQAYDEEQHDVAVEEERRAVLRRKALDRKLARQRELYAAAKGIAPNPPRRTLKPCGTNGAYHRHRRNGQEPCEPCLDAHVRNNSEWRANARTRQNAGM